MPRMTWFDDESSTVEETSPTPISDVPAPVASEGPLLLLGDCLNVIRTFPDASIDACVTDPPAGIEFMGKEWDSFSTREANASGPQTHTWHDNGGKNPYARKATPRYQGKTHESLLPFQDFIAEVFTEVYRVLKPGGHAVVWALPRTSHHTAMGLERAGFDIRDNGTYLFHLFGTGFPKSKNLDGDWKGWGTALKPAVEFWILARKPLVGTVAANVQAHGTGALNIDACRIGFSSDEDKARAFPGGRTTSHGAGSLAGPGAAQDAKRSGFEAERNAQGRFPANLILDEGAAALLDEQSPSASRFFYVPKAPKSDKGEDNTHPTVKNTALMAWLCKLVTPPGGTVLDPFMGSGSTGVAALREGFNFIGIEREAEYFKIAQKRVKK